MHPELLARIGVAHRLAQLDVGEEPRQRERHGSNGHGDQEDGLNGVHDPFHEAGVDQPGAGGLSDFGSAALSAPDRWAGTDFRCRAWMTLVASRLAKMAPNTAVPNEPPIMRKNVTPDVAVPSCSYGTAFWTATTRTCMTRPSPTPNTKR